MIQYPGMKLIDENVGVDGQSRLCLFAKSRIKEGEELRCGSGDLPWRKKEHESHLEEDDLKFGLQFEKDPTKILEEGTGGVCQITIPGQQIEGENG